MDFLSFIVGFFGFGDNIVWGTSIEHTTQSTAAILENK